MGRLFFGNFDVEYDLAGRRGTASAMVRRLNVELQAAWIAIAEKADAIASPDAFDDEWPTVLESAGLPSVPVIGPTDLGNRQYDLCPWGWSAAGVKWGVQQNCAVDAPSLEAVRIANSRVFSVALEQEWNVGLPGAVTVRSLDELRTGLNRLPPDCDRWVVKAEFGMSGRERWRGQGRELPDAAVHWVLSQFRRARRLVLEPRVDRIAEVGVQFTIPNSGDVLLEGVTGLLTDDAGGYRGSRFDVVAESRERWEPAISVARRAAERIQSLGYFGPLGIDAVEYRDADGNSRFRPLQDINARYTMGRLALGFRELLQPGETGVWLHQRWPTDDVATTRRHFDEFRASQPAAVRVVRTSPFTIGGRPVGHGTVVLMGQDETSFK